MKTLELIDKISKHWGEDVKSFTWIGRVFILIPFLLTALLLYIFSGYLVFVRLIELFFKWLFSKKQNNGRV